MNYQETGYVIDHIHHSGDSKSYSLRNLVYNPIDENRILPAHMIKITPKQIILRYARSLLYWLCWK